MVRGISSFTDLAIVAALAGATASIQGPVAVESRPYRGQLDVIEERLLREIKRKADKAKRRPRVPGRV